MKVFRKQRNEPISGKKMGKLKIIGALAAFGVLTAGIMAYQKVAKPMITALYSKDKVDVSNSAISLSERRFLGIGSWALVKIAVNATNTHGRQLAVALLRGDEKSLTSIYSGNIKRVVKRIDEFLEGETRNHENADTFYNGIRGLNRTVKKELIKIAKRKELETWYGKALVICSIRDRKLQSELIGSMETPNELSALLKRHCSDSPTEVRLMIMEQFVKVGG